QAEGRRDLRCPRRGEVSARSPGPAVAVRGGPPGAARLPREGCVGSRRVSIVSLMSLVAILALDLAVVRETYLRSTFLAICVTPIGIALHAALYGSLKCGGVLRGFWIGFGSSGALTTATLVGYAHDPRSTLRVLWEPYLRMVGHLLSSLPNNVSLLIEGSW